MTPNYTIDLVLDQQGRIADEMGANGAQWWRGEIYAGGRQLATYANGITYFTHADWLGTVRARTDNTGALAESCTSLPYGDALSCGSTSPSPAHFTGQVRDFESGLDYFQARHYASSQARFVSPDPSGLAAVDPNDPQTWNRYAYVGGNPLGAVDPLGLDECVMAGGSISTSVSQETCTGGGNTWIKSNVTVEVTPDDSGGGLSGAELDAWELENQTYNFWVEQSVLLQSGSQDSGASNSSATQKSAPVAHAPSYAQCVAHGSDELNPAQAIGLGGNAFARGLFNGPFSTAANALAGGDPVETAGGLGTLFADKGSKAIAGISANPTLTIYPHFTELTDTPQITTWTFPVKEAAGAVAGFFERINPISLAVDATVVSFVAVGCGAFD